MPGKTGNRDNKGIKAGTLFCTEFEMNCIALGEPDELGWFDAFDSEGVICMFAPVMVKEVHGTWKGIKPINPDLVRITTEPIERDIRTQMARLEQEGQIEPIALKSDNSPDLDEWAYADAQVIAAQRLAWPTILVTWSYRSN